MKKLLTVLKILSKYEADQHVYSIVGTDDLSFDKPTPAQIFDKADISILNENGCIWLPNINYWQFYQK